MNRETIRRTVVRYGMLFFVSVLLVAGFWFHGSFYDLGLVPLLFLGGLATFFCLLVVRASSSGRLWRRRPRGELAFRREQGPALIAGTVTLGIFPLNTRVPAAGSVVKATVEGTSHHVTRLEVLDIRRRLVADLREEDAQAAGCEGLEEFLRAWSEGRPWDPREIALVLDLRPEDRP